MMKRAGRAAWFLFVLALGGSCLLAGCDCDDEDRCTGVPCPENPPVPSGVYTITGDRSVQIYWSPIRWDCLERYGVYRSQSAEGPYQWIADVAPSDDPRYIDSGLANGVTYFYAVDAQFDFGESDLSFETIADTPRPEGTNLVVYHADADSLRAGLDLSRGADGEGSDIVQPWGKEFVDYSVILLDGLFRIVPTAFVVDDTTRYNDVQDFGYTDDMDEVNYSPLDGWSLDPFGVELIEGHTYILWTWDDHFAKIRVTRVPDEADYVVLEWAYQLSADEWERRQLAPLFAGASKAPRE
jgi:hypothetical protein